LLGPGKKRKTATSRKSRRNKKKKKKSRHRGNWHQRLDRKKIKRWRRPGVCHEGRKCKRRGGDKTKKKPGSEKTKITIRWGRSKE